MKLDLHKNLMRYQSSLFPKVITDKTLQAASFQINEGTSPERKSIITLDNVIKTYPTPAGDFQALKGISVSITANEFVCIVGKSGAGKTTLLK